MVVKDEYRNTVCTLRRAHGGQTPCRGFCESTLYIPVGGRPRPNNGGGGGGPKEPSAEACGCLVVSFPCAQLGHMQRCGSLCIGVPKCCMDV